MLPQELANDDARVVKPITVSGDPAATIHVEDDGAEGDTTASLYRECSC